MSKCRFTSLDVRCIVRDFQHKLVGLRLANVYDCNNKTYLFKFASSVKKAYVIFESGVCVYSTNFPREHRESPSVFALKFRKAIRAKILRSVNQVFFDRVIDFTFGSEEYAHHLICEFYASGNIILTDHTYRILLLLRPYSLEGEGRVCAIGNVYPITVGQSLSVPSVDQVESVVNESLCSHPSLVLSRCLTSIFTVGIDAIEHCLVKVGLPSRVRVKDYDKSKTPELVSWFERMAEEVRKMEKGPGYVVCDSRRGRDDAAADELDGKQEDSESVRYLKYLPFRFAQYSEYRLLEFDDFDGAVDAYFSNLEKLQEEGKRQAGDRAREQRLEKVREDNKRRVNELQKHAEDCKRSAQLIEDNVEAVEKILSVINEYLSRQVFWTSIEAFVKQERRRGDPLAMMIDSLCLDRKAIVLSFEAKDKSAEGGSALVEVDLGLTAHGNVAKYYAEMRKALEKKQRTIDAQNAALKNAQRKIDAEKNQVRINSQVLNLRKTYWFEKFKWFISSDRFIVVAGRDMFQNEILYKRHLTRGDIYVHADVHGASTCIIKNPTGSQVPPKTLEEAGTMCVCYSSAWKDKSIAAAWWVYDHQVSKTAPTGEYLTTGSFMVRGKKNYLLPRELVMGFGILFCLADESIPNHTQDFESATVEVETSPKDENQVSVQIENYQGETASEIDDGSNHFSEKTQETENAPVLEVCHESELGDAYAVDFAHEDELVDEIAAMDLNGASDVSDRSGKKRMSAYERRQMKKKSQGKTPSVPQVPRVHVEPTEKKPVAPKIKKSKLRKIRKKYKHQDEEERAITEHLLASAGRPKVDGKRHSGAASKKSEEETRLLEEQKKQKLEAQARAQAAKLEREIEEEEIRLLYKEEKLEQLSEKDLEKIKENYAKGLGVNLSAFTGNPKNEDVLLYAMGVCAPYDALSEYKYRVKLVPDNVQKKRKKGKLAIEAFLNDEHSTKNEKDLIRAIPDSEIALVIIPNAKLQMPGMAQLLKKKKQKKKS